jgi:hypothetical protein
VAKLTGDIFTYIAGGDFDISGQPPDIGGFDDDNRGVVRDSGGFDRSTRGFHIYIGGRTADSRGFPIDSRGQLADTGGVPADSCGRPADSHGILIYMSGFCDYRGFTQRSRGNLCLQLCVKHNKKPFYFYRMTNVFKSAFLALPLLFASHRRWRHRHIPGKRQRLPATRTPTLPATR